MCLSEAHPPCLHVTGTSCLRPISIAFSLGLSGTQPIPTQPHSGWSCVADSSGANRQCRLVSVAPYEAIGRGSRQEGIEGDDAGVNSERVLLAGGS